MARRSSSASLRGTREKPLGSGAGGRKAAKAPPSPWKDPEDGEHIQAHLPLPGSSPLYLPHHRCSCAVLASVYPATAVIAR